MMVLDMTAQLSSLMIGMNALTAIAGAAILTSLWQRSAAPFASRRTASSMAVVGSSSSAPAPADDAPGDSSVPEAA